MIKTKGNFNFCKLCKENDNEKIFLYFLFFICCAHLSPL